MAKPTKPAWYGVAAVVLGTGIFFLATNKGRLFKKSTASLKALWNSAPATTPAPTSSSKFGGRTPTPENGHVRDVVATDPPAPNSGSNFTKHGDVHGPQG